MIKHFCDICGKELKQSEGADVIVSKRNIHCSLIYAQEVCEECAKKLKEQFQK